MKRLVLRLWRARGGPAGVIGLVALILSALFADLVPVEPTAARATSVLSAPSWSHPFGTDIEGRDLFASVVRGSRNALRVGFPAVVLMVCLGLSLGAAAGFYGGWLDALVSRLIGILVAYPTLLAVLAWMGITGDSRITNVALVLGMLRWTDVAQLTRAEVLRALASDHALAAQALGMTPRSVLWRHVLPFALTPVLIATPFALVGAIGLDSTLGFLGVGGEGGLSWGTLLGQARLHPAAWWLSAFPGLALFLTATCLNWLGEALRDALDPGAQTR